MQAFGIVVNQRGSGSFLWCADCRGYHVTPAKAIRPVLSPPEGSRMPFGGRLLWTAPF